MISKKLLFGTAALSLMVLTPISARAEDGVITPSVTPKVGLIRQWLENRKDKKEELKDIRQETRTKIKEDRKDLNGTITETKDEFRQKRIAANQNGLYNSFIVREKALQSYQDRIQKRLDAKKVKLPTNQSLIDAQAKLSALTGLYTTFNKDLAIYKTTVDSISSITNPRVLLPTLKAQAKTVNTDIKNIRQALVDALRLVVKAK